MKVQVSTISRSVKYIIRPGTGFMTLRSILIPQGGGCLSINLERIKTADLLGKFRSIIGVLGYVL